MKVKVDRGRERKRCPLDMFTKRKASSLVCGCDIWRKLLLDGEIGGQILGGWGRGRQWTRNRVVSRTNQRKLEHCIALVIKSTFFVCLWQCQESTRTDDDDVDCKISFRVSFLTICFRKYKTDCGVCCASRQSQALFHLMRNTQKINAKSYLEEKRQFFLKFRAI